MCPGGKAFFPEKEKSQEGRFKEEGEYAFHGQWLPNYSTCSSRKVRPIGPKLELHGNSRDHAKQKIDGKYLCPEAGRFVVTLVFSTDGDGLERYDEQRQTHG